jgi:hypothetical protein
MALIQCSECSSEVSDQANKCPKCGNTLRQATRSTFGKIVKWGFIGFNGLMAIWLISGVGSAGQSIDQMGSDAERAGAAIGTALGAGIILFLWLVGAVIGGIAVLLTRPKA